MLTKITFVIPVLLLAACNPGEDPIKQECTQFVVSRIPGAQPNVISGYVELCVAAGGAEIFAENVQRGAENQEAARRQELERRMEEFNRMIDEVDSRYQ